MIPGSTVIAVNVTPVESAHPAEMSDWQFLGAGPRVSHTIAVIHEPFQ